MAKKNLAHAQKLLAQSLTSAYKSTDEDVVSFLLASPFVHRAGRPRAGAAAGQRREQQPDRADRPDQEGDRRPHAPALDRDGAAGRRISGAAGGQAARGGGPALAAGAQVADQRRHPAPDRPAAGARAGGRDGRRGCGQRRRQCRRHRRQHPGASVQHARRPGRRDRRAVPGSAVRVGRRPPSGFDCSGLVMYVYGQLGVSLPHNAAAQYSMRPARSPRTTSSPATSCSSTASATSASTSAAARSSTLRTPAPWCRSARCPAGTGPVRRRARIG